MKINTDIKSNLTETEQKLFTILMEVVSKKAPGVTLRCAGGWVRDKLLGTPSNDIDIMVDKIPGETFAKIVAEYMNLKDPHVIKENPEKSKFISTAKAYIPINGTIQEVDFAQARKEVYSGDSRIPTTQIATAQEDAYRRDATINSMFYNINENKLEDFTGLGIKDLIGNTIRTPEEPLKTFKDDPLRILRLIRFAAKYNAQIDPDTFKAMLDPTLREEIKKKISKERIGTEITKMLKNQNPEIAINLLKDSGLLDDIIIESLKGTRYEGQIDKLDMAQNSLYHKLNLWEHTMQVVKNVLSQDENTEPEQRIVTILGALMHDFGKLFYAIRGTNKAGGSSYHGHENESKEITSHILKYLKMEPYIDKVGKLAQWHMKPHTLIQEETTDKTLRKFIRECGEQSLNWLDVLNLSIADAQAKDITIDPAITQKYLDLKNRLQGAIISLQVNTTDNKIKPILDGTEIMQTLNVKPGAHMKEMMDFVKDLKDENPNITKDEAKQKLISRFRKTASSTENTEGNSVCPNHLLFQKQKDIENAENYEIISILKQLQTKHGGDERVQQLIARNMFNLILKDQKLKDNQVLQYLFDKAQDNFFNPLLCVYVFGILLLIKTPTEIETIKKIGERLTNMAPELLSKILTQLPSNCYHKEIKKEFQK